MAISGEIIQTLLLLLRPHLQDEKERKGYLIRALGTKADALNLIWSQPVNTFVPEMVKELETFGEVTPGQPALCTLLEVLRADVGVDTQDKIDKLIQQIREELQKAEITSNWLQTTDALIEQVEQYLSDPNRYIFLNNLLLQEAKFLAEMIQGELEFCPWVLSKQNQSQCQQCIEYLEAKSERFVRILATIVQHDQNAQFVTSIAKAFKILARQSVPINTTFTDESRFVRLYPLALAIYGVFIVGVQEEREQLLRTVLGIRWNRQANSYDVRQITHNINLGAFIVDAIAMPKQVTIEPHLSVEQLENGYRQASEPVKRTHYQIIWLLAKGMRTQEVVAATGYSRSWIYELVWGYNRIGPETLGDQRTSNRGSSEPLLDDVQQALLWQALQQA